MKTQNALIEQYLSKGYTLSPAVARSRFGVQNLRARIHELRSYNGLNIATNITPRGAVYSFKTKRNK